MAKWVVLEQKWHETNVLNCSVCGKMIPSRMWVAEIDGQEHVFCNPECEALYHNYWEPKYGHKWPTNDSACAMK